MFQRKHNGNSNDGGYFFSKKEWRIIAGLSLMAFVIRIPLVFRPVKALTQLPYGDDAYYLFSIAKNIARGIGPTVDGTHVTNGFQPLITFIYVPLYWLANGDAWLAVRFSFILSGIISAISVWEVAKLVRQLETPGTNIRMGWVNPPLIAAAIWSLSISIFLYTTNGLETGAYSLMLLLAMRYYALMRRNTAEAAINKKYALLLGATLGFAVLARIDAVFLVIIIAAMEIWAKRFFNGTIVSGLALLISLPWWIFNLLSLGSLMPTSGQAENIWPLPDGENIRRAIQAITDIAMLFVYAPGDWKFNHYLPLAICVFILAAILIWKTHALEWLREKTFASAILPFAAFSGVLLIYYLIFFKAPHFIPRYLQPMRILWLLFVSLTFPAAFDAVKQSKFYSALCIIIPLGLIAGIAFGANRYWTNCYATPKPTDFYDMGLYATAHPDEKIGMLQSGIASYVAPNIINLDGKVNTAALRAHQQGKLARYLRDENFTYIADWKLLVEDLAAIAREGNLQFDSTEMIGAIQLMKRRDR